MENINIFSLYFGSDKDNYKKYSDILGITDDLNRKVATYSKGMKRKLSLLIIVLMDRGIIFLDEVTSGVDPLSRVEIRGGQDPCHNLSRLVRDRKSCR